jgi:hypothetical protein
MLMESIASTLISVAVTNVFPTGNSFFGATGTLQQSIFQKPRAQGVYLNIFSFSRGQVKSRDMSFTQRLSV